MEHPKRVGIMGSGETTQAIALVVAIAGYEVVLWHMEKASPERGTGPLAELLEPAMSSGALARGKEAEILDRLTLAAEMRGLSDCQLVIESAPEDMELKKRLCAEITGVVSQGALVATTTSCLSVTEIAQSADGPDRILGLHFLSPPLTKRLVEVVRAVQTSEAAMERALGFCSAIGKEAVVVKDSPGFIVNYLFVPYMNQALDAFDHGLASMEDLDKALEMGLGYPTGPLRLIDHLGLDEHLRVSSTLHEQLGDQRFAPPPILRRMVHGGKLGRKTGQGFYTYPSED